MELKLPPDKEGKQITLDLHHPMVIIGANGAGKSRFAERLAADNPGRLWRLSALDALYPTGRHDAGPVSIDSMYEARAAQAAFLKPDVATRFDRLMALLLLDEMSGLLKFKTSEHTRKRRDGTLPKSRLDVVIKAWREVFPDNRVLRQVGSLLFQRSDAPDDSYQARRLSDGERAVLYYFGSALYAPKNALVIVESPAIFLHPSIVPAIWDRVEQARPDCTFVYSTNNVEFLASRASVEVVWVRRYDAPAGRWDYTLLPPGAAVSEELYSALVGSRKPVLFIEGDATHSIDAKLYPLVFTDYTVRSLGSCDKVIEATRTFNDLCSLHHLDSRGIVDRDRRGAPEVDYLRRKRIFVPEVAEIENILMLEEVIKTVASSRGKDARRVFEQVKHSVMAQFKADLRRQALLHTRHRVKRITECRIDGRFPNIAKLEEHMVNLVNEVRPREIYDALCREFHSYLVADDYASVLRVYNQKSMLPNSNVAGLCGLANKEKYVEAIISILKRDGAHAGRIRRAITACFGIDEEQAAAPRQQLSPVADDDEPND